MKLRDIKFRDCLLPFDWESFAFPLLPKNKNIKLYRTTVFPVVLYIHTYICVCVCVCETWSITLCCSILYYYIVFYCFICADVV